MEEIIKIIFLILLFLLIIFCFFPYLLKSYTLDQSQIFFNFAVGFGAIIGALGGSFYAIAKETREYLSRKKREVYAKQLRELYPREKLNETFKLVDTEKNQGIIYLVDLNKKERYWIMNPQTLIDLQFSWGDAKRIDEVEFNSFSEGTAIITSGTKGY